jgi:hypothetical protein
MSLLRSEPFDRFGEPDVRTRPRTKQWSARRRLVFILVSSSLLWAAILIGASHAI